MWRDLTGGVSNAQENEWSGLELPTGTETILVVEDDEPVRTLACLILEGVGYQVLAAGASECALRIARQHAGPIHLLLTDVVLPERSGQQVAATLLREHPGMKVLYMSGYGDDIVISHGGPVVAGDFLPKPFGPAALARKVRGVLDEGLGS
jgi:two-component system cell cycle sensor histidine kinase/response regulator CckA